MSAITQPRANLRPAPRRGERLFGLGLGLAILLPAGCQENPRGSWRGVPRAEALPQWLNELIDQMELEPPANPPALVAEYTYQDQTVYYVPPSCCDVPSTLYDAEGNVLCHPDGGFTGAGDGLCTDFFDERADERIVWQDPRE